MKLRILVAALVAATAGVAHADPINWTYWSSSVAANPGGSASGTAGSVGVSYSGELQNLYNSYPSYTPTSTFSGGIVGNIPGTPDASTDQIIQLVGGGGDRATVDTITFSTPVWNPVMAIWSLGSGGNPAMFNFSNVTPTLQSGGPGAEYGGSSIVVNGNVVSGAEGDGTVAFLGLVKSISWTNPVPEGWYGFTVGVDAVPEPQEWALGALGLVAIGAVLRRKRRA